MLKKCSFADYKPAKMPNSSSLKISVALSRADVNPTLRGMIGSPLHLTASRPDIISPTSMCSHYQENPKESHLLDVKRIFRYLKHTPNLGFGILVTLNLM